MTPREAENSAYAKFWGDKQGALWHVVVFSAVVSLSYLHWYACGVDGKTVGLMGVRSRDYQKFLG